MVHSVVCVITDMIQLWTLEAQILLQNANTQSFEKTFGK